MQPDRMTQGEATQRAWAAAEEAERLALAGQDSARWSKVAQAWAAVARQLLAAGGDEMLLPEPALHPGQIAVPVPRPLRETDEQQAALDALHGVDPLDPRVPVDELDATERLAVKAHEPLDYATQQAGAGVCRGCSQPIEWHGGVWVDISGGALCRTLSR